ncbi:MAG TPA: SAF domain-containing protein [Jiangellaceae bacterium]|jgi:Flp pilus assembly protein CpaB|nr:SAF domain-containing protein [Jiangellaceae bacterium]
MDPFRLAFSRFARTVGWHRRLLAAGLAAGAVALALQAAEPEPDPTVPVVAAAHDLPGGTRLSVDDLRLVEFPPDRVPAGAVASIDAAVGEQLAGPVREGEPLTDVRMLGPGVLTGWGVDLVATPVRVADPGVVALVRPGDSVDLYATPVSGLGPAAVVAGQVPVLAIPATADDAVLAEGALLVVGTTARQAAVLAEAAVTSRLSLTLRPA